MASIMGKSNLTTATAATRTEITTAPAAKTASSETLDYDYLNNNNNKPVSKAELDNKRYLEEVNNWCDSDSNKKCCNNNNTTVINNNNSYDKLNTKSDIEVISEEKEVEYNYFGFKVRSKLKWANIIGIVIIHIMFVYALLHSPLVPSIWTYAWGFLMGGLGGFGVTGGVHRLWSHKSYKAKTPLRVILMLCFSLAGQNPIYDWVRDHRVHHKFSETKADPHDSNRGFFFAHVGWLMMNKHPEVVRKGQQLDMSDILSDPVVQFHQKYFIPLKLLLCFIIPTAVPMYAWGESFFWSFYSQCVLRYVMNLNFTWLVNSAAHMWGTRPYDKRINPAQNLSVSIVAMGEGWHNYHHVFPWDYKAAELGHYFNVTTFWINQFAKIGWAYDLKQPTPDLIKNTIMKCGDKSHPTFGHHMSEVPPPDETKEKMM